MASHKANFTKCYKRYQKRKQSASKSVKGIHWNIQCFGRWLTIDIQRRIFHSLTFAILLVTFLVILFSNMTVMDMKQVDYEHRKVCNIFTSVGRPNMSSHLPILPPHCLSLIKGIPQEIALTHNMLFKETRKQRAPEHYLQVTKNCSYFTADYWLSAGHPSEESFPIAYSVCIHKSIEQVERLLRAIYRPWNIYCVHIDQKAPSIFHEAIRGITHCLPNVFVASKLEWVVSGGYSQLQADINCLSDLIKTNIPWKYALNLAGHEFPLKSNSKIVHELKKLEHKKSIRSYNPPQHTKENFNFVHERTLEDDIEKVKRTTHLKSPPPGNITIRYGSAYNIYSRDLVDYVLHDSYVQNLLHWFEDTYRPFDHFWATVQTLDGAPGGSTNDIWAGIVRALKCCRCHRAYDSGKTCVYGVEDLRWLTNQQQLFANKFDLDKDHVVYECLEHFITNKSNPGNKALLK